MRFNDSIETQNANAQKSFQYRTGLPPVDLDRNGFAGKCSPYAAGCKGFNITASVVGTSNQLRATETRAKSSNTELVGGPFKARGDGALYNPDALSNALTPNGCFRKKCAKRLSEVTYDTWACIDIQNQAEVEIDKRGGIDTRSGLQYMSNC